MEIAKLVQLHQALLAAAEGLAMRGAELERLRDQEMIPVQHHPQQRTDRLVRDALPIVEELLKQAQGGASGPRAVPS